MDVAACPNVKRHTLQPLLLKPPLDIAKQSTAEKSESLRLAVDHTVVNNLDLVQVVHQLLIDIHIVVELSFGVQHLA
jgi:hypothetical protein